MRSTTILRRIAVMTCLTALAAIAVTSSRTQPVLGPYWIGDFQSGDYCQYATIFQSSTVNSDLGPDGHVSACPQYTPFSRDPAQRVHLTGRPAPPAGTASGWVSHQELRTTDGPWFPGISTAKSTIRLTPEQTLNGPFSMGMERWFRVSFYLPNPGFNWPLSSWYNLFDLHNAVRDPAGKQWPTLALMVVSYGKKAYVAFDLDGVSAGSNHQVVRLLQLTKADGSRVVPVAKSRTQKRRPLPKPPRPFNRWHTLIVGVKFSDQGKIGDSPGWVRIYFDGKLAYDKARPNVWANETNIWLQLQNYKRHDAALVNGATSSKVYFADARIGYTFGSVKR